MSGSSTPFSALSVKAAGQIYTGWNEVSVSRGIQDCASRFTLKGVAGPGGWVTSLPITPYAAVTLMTASQPMLTGYVDGYDIEFGADQHVATISGRSKTAQLVDCTPDIPAGQFLGYDMQAIVTAVCKIFGVTATIQTDLAATPVTDATLERDETAFIFLDRMATLAGVLLCDDGGGALLITNAGGQLASGRLLQGGNIKSSRLTYNGERRFSTYILKGQAGISAGGGQVQTQQRAVANDPGVPLYRPKVAICESQLDQAQMQIRVNWQRSYAYGQSLKAVVTVPGWLQPDGTLWQINQLVPVTSEFLGVDEDLLILQTDFKFSLSDGHTTEITVGPVDGAIPSPSLLKGKRRRTHKGAKGSSAYPWSGVMPG
jgi:prophage tail gpP-like protein